MFEKILIANRGEIACRVIKTARRMGIATVAVYSDADAGALHVRMADEAVHIGPPPVEPVLYRHRPDPRGRAGRPGREAVHPGYGFLSRAGRLRRGAGGGGGRLHRAAGRGDPRRWATRSPRRSSRPRRGLDGAGLHGADRRRRARGEDRARDRLSGDDQGLGRRRRQGDAHRLGRRGGARGLRAVAVGGGVELRRRPHLHREVRDPAAAHRDPGARRQARDLPLPRTSASARSSGGTRR